MGEKYRIAYLTENGEPIKVSIPSDGADGELDLAAQAIREYRGTQKQLAGMKLMLMRFVAAFSAAQNNNELSHIDIDDIDAARRLIDAG